jgi:predicted NBD/HSP70 family sugar kinase
MPGRRAKRAPRTLVLDIGGTHVKATIVGRPTVYRIPSGPKLTPGEMVRAIQARLDRRSYERVSAGFPGVVVHGRMLSQPYHLGRGWIGFDLAKALGRPTRIVNDAAMQALGSYRGGRMLFLGLGTGLGSAMIVDGVLAPMELAHLPYKKGLTYEECLGDSARRRLGKKRWKKEVFNVVAQLSTALEPDYVVLGGGNVKRLKELPPKTVRGSNANAFVGGARLWDGHLVTSL